MLSARRLILFLAGVLTLASSLHAAPSRVVSLDLCMDWLLAHHVPDHQIRALSPFYLDYPVPELARALPVHDGSLEAVVHAQPDLVLVGQYNALMLRERLKQLGVPVTVLPLPQTLSAVTDYERAFLRLVGLPESQARPAPQPRPRTGKRLLLLEPNGIGTGRNTFENELIEYAGWINYLEDSGIVRLDLERIAQDPPDAIHWTASPHPALANRIAEHPVLSKVIAPEQHLQTEPWRWGCPGPWTWDLIEQLAE